MISDDRVSHGKRIQQRTGKTFHVATRLLPERIRHPTYVLYGFFRIADEVVDAADAGPSARQRAELDRIRRAALGEVATDDPVLSAFCDVQEQYGIADADVEAFLDAMAADIETEQYATYAELEAYMDGSAAAVGRMMTALMDVEDPERALPRATALGEAFQLTNFLRDVREDVLERDRVYLPVETLESHGASVDQVRALEFDGNLSNAIRAELRRAESLYAKGVSGIRYLPADCQLGVLLAAVLYADHHRLIRELGYDTVSTTPSLSTRRKLWLAARTRWAWQWTDDPEAVFRGLTDGFESTGSTGPLGEHGIRRCRLVSYLTR